MSHPFTVKSMTGQPVIAIDSAEQVGKIRHFVVSPDVSRVDRLHIDGRKKNAAFVSWEDLESFGADRVMLRSGAEPTPAEDERDDEAARGQIVLLGTRILDTAGFERGTVADATFDPTSGKIINVTTSEKDEIPASGIHSLGSYAMVIDAAE